MTRVLDATDPSVRPQAVREAVAAIRRGSAVVLPTETVYAVVADAFSPRGTAALARVKGRESAAGLPVAVASLRAFAGIAPPLPEAGQRLVRACWPGPLTIVTRQQPTLAWTIGTAADPLSVRMPLHPLVLEVLHQVGPCVVVAANAAGGAPPTTLADALEQLGDAVSLAVDAGALVESGEAPATSSAVDVRGKVPVLIRDGAFPLGRLRRVVPDLVDPTEVAS